ncbi:MAG: polyphenol oxidase family protein [Deltaproteobacteria bacterium]|nr:MAG: polyphenol oxidase family protein [Deltaproteobacteria bacterium]
MSPRLTHALLREWAVEHGFGQRGSVPPDGLLRPRQVHGACVELVGESGWEEPPEADAVVSTLPGRPVGVVTADCVPVLAASRCGSAVAAIHAGWRGLAHGVVRRGLDALRAAAPAGAELRAVMGPHIGPCCYEIDAPVGEALYRRFGTKLSAALRPSRPGHHWLDLGRLVRHEIESAELDPECIGSLPASCTRCDAARFHSYRRDGVRAGRLVHYICAHADGGLARPLDTSCGSS